MATNGMAANGTVDGRSSQQVEVERMCAIAVQAFHEKFGEDAMPELGVYAPGRVNLMGGSIDYSGGPVVPVVGRAGARGRGGRAGEKGDNGDT